MMLDSSQMVEEFERGGEAYVSFQYISREIENGMNSLLAKILFRSDMGYLYDTLESVLRELVQNGVKANMKRVWFQGLKLDIHNEDDYRKGMPGFKDVVYQPDLMKARLLDSDYRVIVKFRKGSGGIEIDISNNTGVLPGELERMKARMDKGRKCNSFSEAYDNLYDSSEGAGLGIILATLLMKNAGLGADAFSITPENNSLKMSLRIPRELKSHETVTLIKKRILDDVKALPTFPESVTRLRALCETTDTSIELISDTIARDPSIAADVLKLSNSAGFITGKRIRKISEAVVILGMKNIYSIVTAAASRTIIDKRYRRFEQVWEHCNRTAFYARNIAMESGHADLADGVFTAALLHDIGKIVLLATDLSLVNQISEMVDNRKIRSTTILEELFIGISHSTIGALIAEKWNFPDDLVEAIRFHHTPLDTAILNRDMVMIVYMANQICNSENKHGDIGFYETEVLGRFGLGSRAVLDGLSGNLRRRYNDHRLFLAGKAR
ncbi:MAG: HDOD domain-containing protein [Chrysiogenales bacterium]|nr:MAG: HDOD domain-containing protein [Chrysiogenales bacterium]